MDYHLAINRNEVLTHTTTWMDPENMLSEISQKQKDKYNMISLIGIMYNEQIHRDRK